jgi:hypothetical protein
MPDAVWLTRKPAAKKVVLFFPPGPSPSFRMHYVVKSGRSAAMRGALKRKTACPSIVVAPDAQLNGVSNDPAFCLPYFTQCCRFGGASVLLAAGDQDPPCLGVA